MTKIQPRHEVITLPIVIMSITLAPQPILAIQNIGSITVSTYRDAHYRQGPQEQTQAHPNEHTHR